jgi:RNA polymerase sigma-70 factor (ECF subfamily)
MAPEALNPDELEERLTQLHADSFGWALSCCGWNEVEAEDVVQTTYVKVLSGQARYAGRSSFRTWLFGVVRLTALERRRRESSIHRRAERLATEWAPDLEAADAPDEALVEREQASRLRAALDELPARQREVVHLVFYQGLSVAEAADAMDVSLGSARTHYHRGKDRLRSLLVMEESP